MCFICIVSGLGQRCEPLRKRHHCNGVKGVPLGVGKTRDECQGLCEHFRAGEWGCCQFQLSGKCTFYDNTLEDFDDTRNDYAAQCGGEG